MVSLLGIVVLVAVAAVVVVRKRKIRAPLWAPPPPEDYLQSKMHGSLSSLHTTAVRFHPRKSARAWGPSRQTCAPGGSG